MRYIFLLNSFSLREKTNQVKKNTMKIAKKRKLDYVIEINDDNLSTEDILNKYKRSKNIIIAIGGDGTINRVLNSIVGTKNILGYIPYGTGNDFYRSNKEILEEGINEIDLISINNSYFINIACFGIDADIGNHRYVHNNLIPKSKRYNLGLAITLLKYRPKELEIKFKRKTIKGKFTTVVVCNARYYGGGYKISPNSLLDDGLLDLYVVDNTNKINMIRLINGMKNALHEKSDKVNKYQVKELTIKSNKEIIANVDGEALIDEEFKIRLIPKGISIYYDQDLIDEVLK